MKANELMIGDWVIGGSEEPFKIGIIDPDFLHWNEVQPIPLTPEILEKNGFEKALQLSDIEPFDTDEEGNKYYSYNKTLWGWWQPDNIFCIPDNGLGWLNIKYVHELKHALRLCGIEKTIEL